MGRRLRILGQRAPRRRVRGPSPPSDAHRGLWRTRRRSQGAAPKRRAAAPRRHCAAQVRRQAPPHRAARGLLHRPLRARAPARRRAGLCRRGGGDGARLRDSELGRRHGRARDAARRRAASRLRPQLPRGHRNVVSGRRAAVARGGEDGGCGAGAEATAWRAAPRRADGRLWPLHSGRRVLSCGPASGQPARPPRRPHRAHRLRAGQADLGHDARDARPTHDRAGGADQVRRHRRDAGRDGAHRRPRPRARRAPGARRARRGPRGGGHVDLRRRARAAARRVRAERVVAEVAGDGARVVPPGPRPRRARRSPRQGHRSRPRRRLVPRAALGARRRRGARPPEEAPSRHARPVPHHRGHRARLGRRQGAPRGRPRPQVGPARPLSAAATEMTSRGRNDF
mmetsp:Transcript_16282/g.54921  ORF Transcript_16282/g.54921 Transcript_16282/m.54921 type:complete len:398 (-) Transcript_16282:10-1203(-)